MGTAKRITPECEIATGCLASQLRLLNRVITNIYDDAMRPHGLRVSQMSILVAVAMAGPVRAVDVAGRLRLDTSTLSRDLERLVEHGWVRSSPGKGRARRLEITATGRELLAKVLKDWREAQQKARKLLPTATVDAIATAANALRDANNAE